MKCMEKDSEGKPHQTNYNKYARHCFIIAILLLGIALVFTVYLAVINRISVEMIIGSDLALAAIFIALGFYFRDDFKNMDTLNQSEQKDEIFSCLKRIFDQLDQLHPTTHGIYQTQNDTLENTRVAYEFRNQRSLELAGYIRLLDAGVWGFLGFAAIELFRDNWTSNTIIFFCIIVIIAMYLWRRMALKYNEDIIEEYIKILYCECALNLDDAISLKDSLIPKMDNKTEYCCLTNKEQYHKLIRDLKRGKQPETGHKNWDKIALVAIIVAVFILLILGLPKIISFFSLV